MPHGSLIAARPLLARMGMSRPLVPAIFAACTLGCSPALYGAASVGEARAAAERTEARQLEARRRMEHEQMLRARWGIEPASEPRAAAIGPGVHGTSTEVGEWDR
jgi:hypothetical protein